MFEKLKNRRPVDCDQYELLHTGAQTAPIFAEAGGFALREIGQSGVTLGARYYGEVSS